MEKTYKIKAGSRVPLSKAQSYGEYLQSLKEMMGDKGLTPEFIVKKAKSKKAPIHDYFEWDDSEAAEQYRLSQARELTRSITIVIKYDNDTTEETRAFQHIPIIMEDGSIDSGYRSFDEIKVNVSFQKSLIENARGEYKSWLSRYNQYKHYKEFQPLAPIFSTIEKVELEYAKD